MKYFFTSLLVFTIFSAGCGIKQRNTDTQAKAVLLRADFTSGEITRLCTTAIGEAQKQLDEIAQLPADQRNFDNTMLKFETAFADSNDKAQPLIFMGYVHTNKAVRAEAADCEDKFGEFWVGVNSRRDLYNALKSAQPRSSEEKRLATVTLHGFEMNGLNLPDDKLAQVATLKQTLASLETKFSANLNNDVSTVTFTKSELAGVPADYISTLKTEAAGNYISNTKPTDYEIIAENAKDPQARRKIYEAFNDRQGEANTKLLEQAVQIRQQIAALMGYKSWADYNINDRAAPNADAVWNFLNDLKSKLVKANQEDLAKLLAFKKEEDPSATTLEPWDIPYATYQLKKRDYQLDDEKIKEYFPAKIVMDGLFQVYSQLLGVKFVQVPNVHVWSPDVKLYEIHNGSDNRLIAYFYTDFIPRPGKYGHAAAFNLIGGRVLPDGTYSLPVSCIVANLSSLMNHEDVTTVFHEFGHIMHQTLTRAPYESLSGANVAQDFVEAPSQMLENWTWDANILKSLSGYYKDPNQKLPQALLDKMIAARDFNKGYDYTRQLMLAIFDMTIHTQSGSVDVTKTYNDLYRNIIGIEPDTGVRFAATFGHMMGGYDAGYYGYLWSEVYAQDMFTKFQAAGLKSRTVGAQYRKIILEKGNMEPALDLLREFLGREPNADAFYRKLNLN